MRLSCDECIVALFERVCTLSIASLLFTDTRGKEQQCNISKQNSTDILRKLAI
jgi:hypothetical protein